MGVLSTIIILIYISINHVFCGEIKIQYYENLIEENIKKADSYTVPKSSVEFEQGARQNGSKYFGNFDFIIVGAGSAGCVMANRLSEIQSWKILLLEAGGEETDFSDIPAMQSYLFKSEMNWGYETVPQKHTCFGNKENRCSIKRGRVIGGTSTINGAHYVRGNRRDFDKWVELGNTDWSYIQVLPYFKKSENSQIDGDAFYHGKGGPLNVEHSIPDIQTFPILVEANLELGRKYIDYNGKGQIGYSKLQSTTKNGKRDSTGRAFLSKARRRPNLSVITKALVTKVIIDKNSKSAQGVYFVKNGQKYTALADKEVILSGGTFNSAQLLMLSGIGPRAHLRAINVELVKDLPVGKNLIEQPIFTLNFKTNFSIEKISMREQIRMYLNGTGPLTLGGKKSVIGFENLGFIPEGVPLFEYQYGDDDKSVSFFTLLHHPKSRGILKLKSNNPTEFPLIDLNLLSHPSDAEGLLKTMEYIHNLTNTKAFQKINTIYVDDVEDCNKIPKNTKSYWDCFLGYKIQFLCQPVGTASMGEFKNNSVVDQQLRVHGVSNLRVVDASIIPTTMSGHLNAIVIMIAEKAGDIIKTRYQTFFE